MSGLGSSLDFSRDIEKGVADRVSLNDIDYILSSASKKTPPKRVLLLQGPVGSLFRRLQNQLNDQGIEAWRVILNKADDFFGGRDRLLHFKGGHAAWSQWLEAELEAKQFDCIILFGCERPAHTIARRVARKSGITVISLEEGYIRPGYISVEENGNNASSPLAGKVPTGTFSVVQNEEQAVFKKKPLGSYLNAALYYTLNELFNSRRERELNHRQTPIISECAKWLRNVYINLSARQRDLRAIEKLTQNHNKNYYLVALQVAADSNLKEAALGWCSKRLVRESIASFAQDAPDGSQLVFKVHPMERGHNKLNPLIMKTAQKHGVADRVSIIEVGPLGLLAEHAAGLITINSTSGLSAIYHGTPLLIIGRAIYEHPKLAVCSHGKPDFSTFWHKTNVASHDFRMNYLGWLTKHALKSGDLYNRAGQDVAIDGILAKLTGATTTCAGTVEKERAN